MENIPKYKSEKFICPHCNILAKQEWFESYNLSNFFYKLCDSFYLDYRHNIESYSEKEIRAFIESIKKYIPRYIFDNILPKNLSISFCQNCNNYSLWISEKLIFPRTVPIDPPNQDLNDEIKALYNEAKLILNDSPKGAAALLRLALQKLLIQLGMKGKNINEDIGKLVKERQLPSEVQKALDIVRVIGNNAVHPGEINLDDNKEIALRLFKILNFIANKLITEPKELNNLYEEIIPEKIKQSIKKRDND
jgi:hypothetical protein